MNFWFRVLGNFFVDAAFLRTRQDGASDPLRGVKHMRDKKNMNDLSTIRRRQDDGLGSNSDIGNKLRALYGAVQEEGIPNKLLELLERLDEVERQDKSGKDE